MPRPHHLPLSSSAYGAVHVAVVGALAVRTGTITLPVRPTTGTWIGVVVLATVALWLPADRAADAIGRVVGGSRLAGVALALPGVAFGLATLGASRGATAGSAELFGTATVASLTAAVVLYATARSRYAALVTGGGDLVATWTARRSRRYSLLWSLIGAIGVAATVAVTNALLGDASRGLVAAGVAGLIHFGVQAFFGDRREYTYVAYDDGLAIGRATGPGGPTRFVPWSRFRGVERTDRSVRLRRPFPLPGYDLSTDDLTDPRDVERTLTRLVRRG